MESEKLLFTQLAFRQRTRGYGRTNSNQRFDVALNNKEGLYMFITLETIKSKGADHKFFVVHSASGCKINVRSIAEIYLRIFKCDSVEELFVCNYHT